MTDLQVEAKDTADKQQPRRRRGAKARAKLHNDHDDEKEEKEEKKENKLLSMKSSKTSKKRKADSSGSSNSSSSKNNDNKNNNCSSKAPKPGEEGYLSPTQLRNARKRRAMKRKKQKINSSHDHGAITTSHCEKQKVRKLQHDLYPQRNNLSDAQTIISTTCKKSTKKNSNHNSHSHQDPSTQYLSNPTSCPIIQKAKQYFDELNLPFKTTIGKLTGWRTVSKLPVRLDSQNNVIIGLFKPKSHSVISIPNYPAHHPSINKIILSLQLLCKLLNISPYQEKDGSGYLRYICINVSRRTKKVQLTLVWNSAPFDTIASGMTEDNNDDDALDEKIGNGKEQLQLLLKALQDQKDKLNIHSLWVHFNNQWKHADNIFDYGTTSSSASTTTNNTTARTCQQLWKLMFGPKEMIETLDIPDMIMSENDKVVKLHFSPNVFRQANLDAFTKIIIAIREYIKQYNQQRLSSSSSSSSSQHLPNCLELYGGVGTIGLHLHDLFDTFLSSDENPFNIECFMKSAKLILDHYKCHNDGCNDHKIEYLSKDATSVLQDYELKQKQRERSIDYEILIVDPPRKGLDEFILQSLTGQQNRVDSHDGQCILSGTKLLVYVSCGFDAFKRDCDALLNSKRWTLDHVEGHILFPGSNAIETLAFFKSTL